MNKLLITATILLLSTYSFAQSRSRGLYDNYRFNGSQSVPKYQGGLADDVARMQERRWQEERNSQMHSTNKISCSKLTEMVTRAGYTDMTNCIGSSMLTKAYFFVYNKVGFVIVYIKKNEYDTYGSPYIYCGISSQRWSSFKNGGINSWGKSFHAFISDNVCNCE